MSGESWGASLLWAHAKLAEEARMQRAAAASLRSDVTQGRGTAILRRYWRAQADVEEQRAKALEALHRTVAPIVKAEAHHG